MNRPGTVAEADDLDQMSPHELLQVASEIERHAARVECSDLELSKLFARADQLRDEAFLAFERQMKIRR